MQHTISLGNGILHYSTTDAVFKTLDGKGITMEFHHYCGPMFDTEFGDGGFVYMPEEDSPEWNHLWKQFYGWWEAKGKGIYGGKDFEV